MNYKDIGKKYIKLEKWQRLKKVFTFLLLILIFIFVFFRWTGFISNTPLSWRRPEISVINDSVSFVEQKNDQLWVNLNYSKNHSNIKNATIYVDDYVNSQELIEGNNTYIFKNLESGNHTITYELEWSLFGTTHKSFNWQMYNVSTLTYDTNEDITRSEENINLQIKQSGDFLEYEGVSTAGLYYINTDALNDITRKNNFELNSRTTIEDIINDQNVLVKQATLMEGMNDITLSEVVVDNNGNTEVLKENTDKRYAIVPGGLVRFNDRVYLVISFPFYAYTFGIPEITQFSSYSNENGDVIISDMDWNQNNYDKSGDEYVQIELFSNDDLENPISRNLIELNDFLKDGYVYKGILKNESYFETPSSLNERISWKVTLQMKYGYQNNDIPNLNEDAPKMSNVSSRTAFYHSPSIQDTIDYEFTYQPPKYIYDVEEDGFINNVSILWSTANWTNTPYSKSKISLETKLNEDEWNSYSGLQNLKYDKFAGENAIDDSVIVNSETIDLNEDTLLLRLRVETPEYDWWNDLIKYDVKYIYLPSINN